MTKRKKKSKRAKSDRTRALIEELSSEQRQAVQALESLIAEVRALSPAQVRALREIRTLLDDVLVAQHRTNHLLELALRAGFDDDETARAT